MIRPAMSASVARSVTVSIGSKGPSTPSTPLPPYEYIIIRGVGVRVQGTDMLIRGVGGP
jgi:hypothetical protein